MSGLSSQGEIAVLAAISGTAYVSLHTADPGDTGASELSGGAYARQGPVAFTNSGNNPTVAANTAIVSFPTATTAWGAVSYFGLWTTATGGNYQGSNALTPGKTVSIGDQVRFLAGALTITAN
jgi:hypothetical protein